MRGAGYTLFGTYAIGKLFAHYKKTQNADSPTLLEWWANGWNAANLGQLHEN